MKLMVLTIEVELNKGKGMDIRHNNLNGRCHRFALKKIWK
jgi:hypothetical protein